MGYGPEQAGILPFFVFTHTSPSEVRLERKLGTRFSFVPDLDKAIAQARAAAMDGAVVIRGATSSVRHSRRTAWASSVFISRRSWSTVGSERIIPRRSRVGSTYLNQTVEASAHKVVLLRPPASM